MKGDNRFGVVQQRRHIDLSGFDINLINSAGPNDMNPDDFILGIQGDDSKLLHRFRLKIKEILEDIVTDQGAGDPAVFQVIPMAFGSDLFEGVNVDARKRHGAYSTFGFLYVIYYIPGQSSNHDLTRYSKICVCFLEVKWFLGWGLD